MSLLEARDRALAANKRLVFDMWRGVVNAGHVELADDMLTEDYIQHSPMLPTGREAFKQIFSAVERREIPDLVFPAIVTLIAEGDLVVMAMREELPEPDDSGNYTTTHFNLFRVEDGRLAEHWHSIQGQPGPHLPSPDEGGPQPVTGATGSAQMAMLRADHPALARNKQLVFNAWREVLAAGREDGAQHFFAEGYVDHDPNGQSGLAALRASLARREDGPILPAIDDPLVAMVAEGDLVVMITGRPHPDPRRDGKTYTTTSFEMFRIEDGRIAEHWNGAARPGGSLGPYAE
ncbi:putative SnoaL-like aldol condensation-catalyzing enzyme [Altererythrobacter atlanticus]|nr:nuclear transport factor 2 family protein [Croceibacterium atlanticum]MBB5732847.1 putative SnoaL-like aldol condensation-catalyzing enzyme [Croceibacterium atlanticum]